MMVKFRRFISLIICTVFVIGLCDWSMFFIVKAADNTILDISAGIGSYKEDGMDSEFDNDTMLESMFPVILNENNPFTNTRLWVEDFFRQCTYTYAIGNGRGSLDWNQFFRDKGTSLNSILSYVIPDDNGDKNVLLYAACSLMKADGGSPLCKSIILCSYNKDDSIYNYVVFGISAISGSEDCMFASVNTNTSFYISEDNYSGSVNYEHSDSSNNTGTVGYCTDVEINYSGLLGLMSDTAMFEQVVNNYLTNPTGPMDGKTESFKSLINDLFEVSNNGKKLYLKFQPRVLFIRPNYQSGTLNGEDIRKDIIFGRQVQSETVTDSNSKVSYEYMTLTIDISNSDMIDFGDTSGSMKFKDGSTPVSSEHANNITMSDADKGLLEEAMKGLFLNTLNSAVSWISDNGGINENEIQSKINTLNVDNVRDQVIPKIIITYAEELKKAISSYDINAQYADLMKDGSVEIDFADDCNNSVANLMMTILMHNVASMQVEAGNMSLQNSADFGKGIATVSNFNGSSILVFLSTDGNSGGRTNLNSFATKAGCSEALTLKNLWSRVETNWQKDYITSMYQAYVKSYSLDSNKYRLQFFDNIGESNSFDSSVVGSIRNYATLQDTIQNDVSDISIELTSGSVLQIARYCDVIAEYIVGSSIMYVNDDANSVLSMYNSGIAALITKNYNYESTMLYFPKCTVNGMNLFGSDMAGSQILYSSSDNGGTHWDSLMQHLYRTELAFEIANSSERGEEEGYTVEQMSIALGLSDGDIPEKLQAWKDKDLASTDFGGDSVSINMLAAICALDRMCEFLGIEQWDGTIGEYLQLWEDIPVEKKTSLLQNPILQPSKTGSSLNEFTPEEPLGTFFSIDEKKMSDYWNIGFALSSTFVPMETNVYDASTYTFLNNSDWLYNMEYKYGFYRKALYISNDNNAVNNQLMSASSDGTRVATLSDLLNYDRDIVLYVDNNFYNANKVGDIIGKLDYTSIRNTASSADEPGSLWEDLQNGIKELFDLDTETILKTAGNTYYSQQLFEKSLKLGFKGQESWTSGSFVDSYILSQDDIIEAIKEQDEYTVEQSFAVVSAVYRSDKLFNLLLRAINSDNAVFKSSKSVCANPAATKQDWLSVYNYYMLANLESQMKNDAASSLDVNSPIFIDVFGNILTESGLVIIPAAANPTIVGEKWDPYTVAFPTYYYNGNMIQYDEFTPEFYEWLTGTKIKDDGTFEVIDSEKVLKECGGGYFALDNVGFTIRSAVVSTYDVSALINFEQLQKSATNIKQLFYNIAYFEKTKDLFYNKSLLLSNMITEVLRGAPIEFIDYTYEGLDGNKSVGKYGVYMAYKLEELCDTFLSTGGTIGNSMVTMPNLAFMDGVEYIVLYVFKIMFSLLLIGLALNLYFDAVQNKIGIASVGKFIFTCVCLLISVSLVPDLISWSYYKSNKDLLKDEVGYVMMLNYSKDFDGAEVGITKVTTPESSSELYVKLDDVSLDWWSIIYPVLFTNTFNTVNDLYLNQLEDNLIANQDNVVIKSDGLYMNVKDIFNSTTLQYQPSTKTLINYNYAGDANVASFVLPYYVILDQLVADINAYNTAQQVDAYSYNIGSNGHICTYGIVAPYFSSSKFLEDGFDILGLHYIHQDAGDLSGSPTYGLTFTKDDVDRMKKSEWYSHYTGSLTSSKIESLYDEARDWMANNKKLMGKVPDEVFLKVFAMQMAIQYNNIMGIPDGNSVEIMNVDTRDIMRFMVGDKANVYKYYSYSFSRYVYEEAGTFGVILSAVFLAVLWVSSLFKPILMIVILGIFIINIIGRKILFRKESKCFEGYLIGCACLCLCNYAYAGMLKLSIVAADMGMGTMATLGIGCVIQIVYCIMLVKIFTVEIKDWKNNGFYEYANRGSVVLSNVTHVTNTVMDRVFGGHRNGRTSIRSNQTGRSFLYNMMHKDDVHIDRANKNTNKLPDATENPYNAMAL